MKSPSRALDAKLRDVAIFSQLFSPAARRPAGLLLLFSAVAVVARRAGEQAKSKPQADQTHETDIQTASCQAQTHVNLLPAIGSSGARSADHATGESLPAATSDCAAPSEVAAGQPTVRIIIQYWIGPPTLIGGLRGIRSGAQLAKPSLALIARRPKCQARGSAGPFSRAHRKS